MKNTSMNLDGLKIIDLTLFGDYCGNGLLGKANYLYCKEKLARYAGFYDCFGAYSARCIGYVEKELTAKGKQALEDILTSLENCPLLDDSLYYRLEGKAQQKFVEETIKEYTRKIDNTLNIVNLNYKLPESEIDYIKEFIYDNAEIESDYFYLPSEKEKELEKRYMPQTIYNDMQGQEVKKISVCPDYYITGFGIVHVNNSTIYKEFTIYDFDPAGYDADIMTQIKGGTL